MFNWFKKKKETKFVYKERKEKQKFNVQKGILVLTSQENRSETSEVFGKVHQYTNTQMGKFDSPHVIQVEMTAKYDVINYMMSKDTFTDSGITYYFQKLAKSQIINIQDYEIEKEVVVGMDLVEETS